jgi:putative nucleotidyltransferase with HDIG domain
MPKLSRQDALEAVYTGRLNRREGHIEIPTSLFVEQVDVNMPTLPPLALFVLKDGKFEVLKAADRPYSPLVLSLHETVWARDDQEPMLRRYAEGMIIQPTANEKEGGAEKRMEVLRRSAIVTVQELFENPSPENIAKSTRVVSSFVYVLMRDPKAYLLLTKLSSHDPYTLQHSVGTAVNSIILGRKMGINVESDLLELGLGGLLHDIGKVKVKKEIINKNGPLDELEWEEMRQHSGEGFNIVKDNAQLSDRTKRAILEHHEDKTGTGYPHGKKWVDIDPYAKIVCICDIFNALTTNRSYSTARTPFEAFQMMREKMMHKIDDEIFKHLVLVYGGKFD